MAINRRTLIPIVGLVLLVFAKLLHAQPRGYSLRSDRVEISSSAHWQAWSSPADMVEVDPVGAIRSRFRSMATRAISFFWCSVTDGGRPPTFSGRLPGYPSGSEHFATTSRTARSLGCPLPWRVTRAAM